MYHQQQQKKTKDRNEIAHPTKIKNKKAQKTPNNKKPKGTILKKKTLLILSDKDS